MRQHAFISCQLWGRGSLRNQCQWNPKARQTSIQALRSGDKGLTVPETFMAWAFLTMASGLSTSQYRKELTENWKALILAQKIIKEPNAWRLHQDMGNYLKLITLPGKSKITKREYFGWSFLPSLHKNTGQTNVREGEYHVHQDCNQVQANFSAKSGRLQ